MTKRILPAFACLVGLTLCLSISWGEGQRKTITLQSGEVICDLNGEWDVIVENVGSLSWAGSYPQLWKITQTGADGVGIRMIDDPYNSKGSQVIRGQLDKTGFRVLQLISAASPSGVDAKGEISEDGNGLIITTAFAKLTARRK
jgi:hypothetical protein